MKSHAEVEGLLDLLAESREFEPENWDTARLEFEVSASACPTLTELQTFTELRARLGDAAFENPSVGSLSAHLRTCRPCEQRLAILAESAATVSTTAPTLVVAEPPSYWRIAASILFFAFVAGCIVVGSADFDATTRPDVAVDEVRPQDRSLPTELLASNTRPVPVSEPDIVYLPGEADSRGNRVDQFEIAVAENQDIVVFVKGWDHSCDCVTWKHLAVKPVRQGYVVELDVTDHPPIEQELLVLADDEALAFDARTLEDYRCCLTDSAPDESAYPASEATFACVDTSLSRNSLSFVVSH